MKIPSIALLSVLLGFGLVFSSGCTNRQAQSAPARVPAPAAHSTATTRIASPPSADSIPGIAQREVIRRQERMRQVDEVALRAHQAIAEGDLESAVDGYRKALDGLPAGR